MAFKGIYIDVETGGLDARYNALLSVGLVAFEMGEELKLLGDLKFTINPPNHLSVTGKALEVQGLTWQGFAEDHTQRGWSEAGAFEGFREFLSKHLGESPLDWRYRLWAHNAPFDYEFIREWSRRVPGGAGLFGYRPTFCCTKSLFEIAYGMGLHDCQGSSLDDVLKHFGIHDMGRDGNHSAEDDAYLGLTALHEMKKAGYIHVGN